MKTSIILITLFALLTGCYPEETLEMMQDDGLKVDFEYKVSSSFPGLVKFNNASKGLESFEWHFGFYSDGQEVVSKSASPTITFPSAGQFTVTLIGTLPDSSVISVSKTINI